MPFFVTTSKEDTSFVSAFLLGVASLLLLFTCISTPVVDSMRMYRLSTHIEGAIRYVDVGLWGTCVEPLEITGYNKFVFDPNVHEVCTKSAVGFQLDENVANALHAPKLEGLHKKPHTALLILYPITTALSIFGCIFQVTVHLATRRGNRSLLQGMTSNGVAWMFWYNSFTTLLILFVFIVQISVVAYAKINVAAIRSVTFRDLSFHWGNTIWLSVIAIILHLLELAVLFSVRKKLQKEENNAEIAKAAEASAKKGKGKATARQGQKGTKGKENQEKINTKEEDDTPNLNPPAYDLEGYVAELPREHIPTVDPKSA